MKILNKSKGTVIAEKVEIADTVLSRLIGLLNHAFLPAQEALVITQCRSIHMFFMRFSIDVIFIDKNNIVVGIVNRIPPFHMSPYFLKARRAIELRAGTIEETKTSRGDQLEFKEE